MAVRRRCRPRRRGTSTLLTSSRARCRLTPRAERAHLSRFLATTVISPRALCDAHHRATAQEPVDLPRRRRCCRSRRRGASTLLALLRARRRPLPRAELARLSRAPVTTVTSPCVLCAAHHRAASQKRVGLLRRRRRCRLRRRGASILLALLRVRRRPVPRADRARLSRAPATTVTLPCVLCAAHHRATARERVDLLRQRRRCRPRRRGASALLALLRARRRPLPRAEKARISRDPATTVTSPRTLCDTHHRATAQEPVDLPRRRRCCRSRHRGASALLALLRARRQPLPRAELARLSRAPVTTVTSPCVLCAAHHCAASQERVGLLRRRRRCRLRRRDAPMLLALLRVRRRPLPRADRARLSRAPVTTVTSPCVLCAAHHHATAGERVDLLRQRRRCRPRRRGASTLLALLRARLRPVPRTDWARPSRAPVTTVTSPCVLSDAHHRASAQDRADLHRRRRRCRPRLRGASTLLALLRARRRPVPRADWARPSRAPVTTVTSPCVLSDSHHHAAVRERADLLRRRRRG